MEAKSIARFGGTCAILAGVCYFFAGLFYLMLPAPVGGGSDVGLALEAIHQDATLYTIFHFSLGLGALLAIGSIPALARLAGSVHPGWTGWYRSFSVLGNAAVMFDQFRELGFQPTLAAGYVAGDAATKAVFVAQFEGTLDPKGFLGYGVLGLAIVVISLLALRAKAIPRSLAYVGVALGVTNWLVVIGNVFQIPATISIVAGLAGVILAPIWNIWVGVRMRRSAT
jgi:hypothetical protein